jgi:hypothetical protein
LSVSDHVWRPGETDLTGDLKGVAAIEPDATRALLLRGFCATRGMLSIWWSLKLSALELMIPSNLFALRRASHAFVDRPTLGVF